MGLALVGCGGGEGAQTPTPTAPPEFDAAAYFGGRTITVIVGSSPGGGFDTAARTFASIAPRYIPGSPNVVVENRPGSGQLLGLQTLMRSEPDGLTLGLVHPRWIQAALLGEEVEGFNVDEVAMLGTPAGGYRSALLCVRRDVATTWEEVLALGRDITVPMTELGGNPGSEFVEYVLDGPIRHVVGYGGSAEELAAFDRGETDAVTPCDPAIADRYPEWMEEQLPVPIFWWTQEPSREWLDQLGHTGDLPYASELTGMRTPTAQEEIALAAFESMRSFSHPFGMPSGVPEDVLAFWLETFPNIIQDPEYAEIYNAAGENYGYQPPEEVYGYWEPVRQLDEEGKEIFLRLVGGD